MDPIENARRALAEAIAHKRAELAALEGALAVLLGGEVVAPQNGVKRGPRASQEEREKVYAALTEVDSIKGLAMVTGLGPRIVGAALRSMIETSEVLLEKGKYKQAPPATV